jgi:hypothetical protein
LRVNSVELTGGITERTPRAGVPVYSHHLSAVMVFHKKSGTAGLVDADLTEGAFLRIDDILELRGAPLEPGDRALFL